MPKRKPKRAYAAKRQLPRRKVETRYHARSVLTLECDTSKLSKQSISIARELHTLASKIVGSSRTFFIPTRTQQALLTDLAQCKETHDRFNLVVVAGHANLSGLRLTSDRFVAWKEFAQWIEPFRPTKLVLVACEAGRYLPSSALFEGISSLQEIYGSPVITTQRQASAVKLLVPYLLLGGHLPKDLSPFHVANLALTGGVLFRQIRSEFKRAGPRAGAIWNIIIEEVLKAIVVRKATHDRASEN